MNYFSSYILKSKSKKRYFHGKRKIYDYLTMYFVFADVFIWCRIFALVLLLFLTFVFYGNTLYFCKVIIDKNNYEAKATYIPILGDRNSNGTSGVHNIIPCEWCFGDAVKHSPFYHGSLLCCSKTHLPFVPLSVGTYNISCFFILP